MTDRELMQQALDALLRVWHSERNIKHLEAIEALRARLAQPDLITHADVEQLARIEKLVEDVDPYTAPPQREWQGLTDEEMFSLWVKCPAETEDRFAFARAIEAQLKGKNT